MNVVDSSGWFEFFADGPNADFFSKPILDTKKLIVPALSMFEVFKRIAKQRSDGDALQSVGNERRAFGAEDKTPKKEA